MYISLLDEITPRLYIYSGLILFSLALIPMIVEIEYLVFVIMEHIKSGSTRVSISVWDEITSDLCNEFWR